MDKCVPVGNMIGGGDETRCSCMFNFMKKNTSDDQLKLTVAMMASNNRAAAELKEKHGVGWAEEFEKSFQKLFPEMLQVCPLQAVKVR